MADITLRTCLIEFCIKSNQLHLGNYLPSDLQLTNLTRICLTKMGFSRRIVRRMALETSSSSLKFPQV